MTVFRSIALTVLLVLVLAVPALSVMAQDVESTAEPAIVVVEDAGGDTIENDTILIVGVLVVGFISLGVVVARGGNPDSAATAQLQAWQLNRDYMAAQERAYASASDERKMFVDAIASIVSAIAPLTTFLTSDDALARYLRDVQKPGPEEPTPATGATPGPPRPPEM